MAVTAHRVRNVAWVAFLGMVGACAGPYLGARVAPQPRAGGIKGLPLPHHVATYPGGVSLRFAMAHDVIHERFPRHGSAYYEERNRRVRDALKEETSQGKDARPSQRYWELLDDLAVGLDLLGRHEEAVALMRDKLQKQVQCGLEGKELYSSYANLGTFLILWQIQEGFADKDQAKARIRESIDLIDQAVKVKPDAHFGREVWQSVLEKFLLAVLDDPEQLLKYDMVGNRLDKEIDASTFRAFDVTHWKHDSRWAKSYLNQSQPTDTDQSTRSDLRSRITRVGAEEGWSRIMPTTGFQKPVPFDEPALGIIGMWRYGGGANPHFTLALGEIMMRVGQRYIAWTAYERAAQLADGLGPEPIPEKFVAHCRKRQQVIEAQLPADEVSRLRPRFEQELAFGRKYQKAYQDYEAAQIRAKASIDDAHFYDAFHADHGPIASRVGEEDQFVVVRQGPYLGNVHLSMVFLFAGLFAFLGACVVRYIDRRGEARGLTG